MNELDSMKELVRQDGFLYTKDVVNAGIRKEVLKRFLDEGSLIREARGVYSFSDSFSDEFVLLQIKCKKGILSYGTALYLHGMSDRFPSMISLTVPKSYNVYYLQTELPHVKFHRVKPKWWDIGIMEMTSPQGGLIRVYNKERCICDLLRDRKNTDPQIFSQAVKEYFSLQNYDMIRLMEYAGYFRLEGKIREYMEILL